jgi:RimJ/RimL family protein N-acetyltransferase
MFDLHRLQAMVPAANRPLRTQLTRCGFREEGVLRNGWLDGAGVQDLHVLGMLRSERPGCQLADQATTSSVPVI